MSNVVIDRQKIDILANAISNKSGVPVTMTLAEMVEAVDGIEAGSGGGSSITVEALSVTQNGTYTAQTGHAYSPITVNVAGGGTSGLEFETGTWEPSSDIARGEITWSRTHTEAPVFVLLADMTGTADATTYSNYVFAWCDYYKLWGSGTPYSSSGFRYAQAYYTYRAASSSSTGSGAYVCTQNSDSTSSSATSYPRYWVSPTNFHPYTNSTSRYWRAGRTYKWIAVWKPTT